MSEERKGRGTIVAAVGAKLSDASLAALSGSTQEAADRIAELEAALADIADGVRYTEHGLRGIARRALAANHPERGATNADEQN